MTGAWSFNEETMQFEPQEPFKSKLDEGRTVATEAWMDTVVDPNTDSCSDHDAHGSANPVFSFFWGELPVLHFSVLSKS